MSTRVSLTVTSKEPRSNLILLTKKYIPVYTNTMEVNMFIYDVCRKFEEAKISYAIVGGYAVALHGAVRGTVDIDLVVHWSLANLKKVEKVLGELGLKSRLPIDAKSVYDFREEYINNRNLIAWNFIDPHNGAKQVDIVISYDLKDAKIKKIKTSKGTIRVLSLEDLIEMKRESGRPQDLEDVQALEKL